MGSSSTSTLGSRPGLGPDKSAGVAHLDGFGTLANPRVIPFAQERTSSWIWASAVWLHGPVTDPFAHEANIVGDGRIEEPWLLGHVDDPLPLRSKIDVSRGTTVDGIGAILRVSESQQQLDQGRLSGTRRTDNSDRFPSSDLKRDLMKHRLRSPVGE